MKLGLLVLAVATIGICAYIRLAPSAAARWHVDPELAADPGPGGVRQVVQADIGDFHTAMMQEPRLQVLAGSVEAGHITYIARSKLFGFPDYVSVKQGETGLSVLSRLRFGVSDLGVNRARLKRVAKRLDPVDK